MSTGSLTQLAALGSQDQYLSVAGEITFFKGVYRRHTNFAKESVYMQFNQNPNWGAQTTCVISRTGDLLSKVWLYVKLPALNQPLEKMEFIELKRALMGDINLIGQDGVPLKAVSSTIPYNTSWTAAMNASEYMPIHSPEGILIDGDVTNSLLKNTFVGSTLIDQTAVQSQLPQSVPSNTMALYVDFFRTYQGPFVQEKGPLDEITFDNMIDLQREFVQSNPGKHPRARYCDEVGHALIDKVDLVIGGTLIDSHPGHYLQVWNELTQTPEKKQIGHLIGRSGSEAELEDMAMTEQDLYIPLQFFFCRHLMCSLPLIALQYHQVEVKVTFNQLDKVVAFAGYEYNLQSVTSLNKELGHQASWYAHYNASQSTNSGFVVPRDKRLLDKTRLGIVEARLMCNLVYLEEEERKTFAGSTHEYLVDLLQYQGPMATGKEQTTYHAYFNHPTSELIWVFVPKASILHGEPFNYTALQSSYNAAGDTLKTAKLQFNGYDRFTAMPAEYFREIVPAQYHTSVPTRPIYVYSFALEPEDFRPSGSVNLSRIDNVKLITTHVDFEPTITMQPFLAGDSTNDFGGQIPNAQDTARPEQIARQKLFNALNRQNNSNAVAVHPTSQDNGLFLQTTDGFASEIEKGAELRVYARSKNVLRIKSGMAGLAYAN